MRRAGVAVVAAMVVAVSACGGGGTPPPAAPVSSAAEPSAVTHTPAPTPERDLPGTTAWRIGKVASADELAGFADHAGIAPGTPVTLRVTTTAPSWHAEVYRLGDYGGTGGRLVAQTPEWAGVRQPPVKVEAGNMVTAAHWTPSEPIDTTGWAPGSYLIKLVAATGVQKYVPLAVTSPDMSGAVVLISATNTYQAYNEYGGYSLYRGRQGFDDRARRVSFDRPYDRHGARLVVGYEQPLIAVAERLGIRLAYATNADLEAGPERFHGARGIVSPGHDEYWSVSMRDTVEKLRDQGVNLAFLGANSVYWRVRSADSGRVMEGYKSASEDPVKADATTTAMWRQAPAARAENALVGQLYECFPAKGPMTITDPDFFLYSGTGVRAGQQFPGLLGVEVDRAYPIAGTPPNLRTVAHSPVQCGNVGQTYSDMTYYTTESGAGVFAVGTMYWTKGLMPVAESDTGITPESTRFATAVTENLLRAMAEGPMGRTHPAVGNLAELRANPSTRTGTGGAVG